MTNLRTNRIINRTAIKALVGKRIIKLNKKDLTENNNTSFK